MAFGLFWQHLHALDMLIAIVAGDSDNRAQPLVDIVSSKYSLHDKTNSEDSNDESTYSLPQLTLHLVFPLSCSANSSSMTEHFSVVCYCSLRQRGKVQRRSYSWIPWNKTLTAKTNTKKYVEMLGGKWRWDKARLDLQGELLDPFVSMSFNKFRFLAISTS